MIDPTKPEQHDGPRDPDSVIFLRSPRAQTCPVPWRSAPAVVLGSEGWEDRIHAEPDRLLVAWGGDGTLQAAARLARPCALVAAGTGNDVAADLGLPRGSSKGLLSLRDSARWCSLPMSEVTVTCGTLQHVHPMVNALSAGLGGAAAAKTQRFERKRAHGGAPHVVLMPVGAGGIRPHRRYRQLLVNLILGMHV